MESNTVYINRIGNIAILDTGDAELAKEVIQKLTYRYTTSIQTDKNTKYRRAMHGRQVVSAEDVMASYLDGGYFRGARKILTMTGCLDVLFPLFKQKGKECVLKDVKSEDNRKMYRGVPAWGQVDLDSLRYSQTEALSVVVANDYARLVCPTAYGKSYLIAAICELYPSAKIVVTSYAIDVMRQIHEDLSARLGYNNVTLVNSRVKKSNINYEAPVICISAGSLMNLKHAPDIMIVDEVHEFASDSYKELLMSTLFRYTRMYGLSANERRSDGREQGLLQFFGDIKFRVSPGEAVEHSMIVPIKVGWLAIPHIEGMSGTNTRFSQLKSIAKKKEGIWRNPVRNSYIAKAARQFDENTQVLITVQTVEHALYLKKLLPEYTLVYRTCADKAWFNFTKRGLIDKGQHRVTNDEMERYRKDFTSGKLKKVIATTVWNRGMNFRELAVVIRADGADSEVSDVQIPGRVARLHSSKEVGYVLDVYDNWDPGFRRKSDSRRRRYAKMGWEQFQVNLDGESHDSG